MIECQTIEVGTKDLIASLCEGAMKQIEDLEIFDGGEGPARGRLRQIEMIVNGSLSRTVDNFFGRALW